MTTRRVLLVVIAAAMLAWSPSARAVDLSFRVQIGYGIDPDGTGRLSATTDPYGEGSFTWAACPPSGVCSPVASDPKTDRVVHVGDAAVGTVFVATAVNGSQVANATSVPYLGPLRSIAPPQIKGEPRVGALVKPLPGSWSGGWGNETSGLQTQVCRTPDESACVMIASDAGAGCPGGGAVLTPDHRGQFVRVVEGRIGTEPVIPLLAVPLDFLSPPPPVGPRWPPGGPHRIVTGPNAAVAVAGPIAPPTGPPESCGQPPSPSSVVLAAHPARERGRLVLGRITCPAGCSVYVSADQRKRRVRLARSFSARYAPWRLRLPARLARRLMPALATVSVSNRYPAPGGLLATRRVRLPQL